MSDGRKLPAYQEYINQGKRKRDNFATPETPSTSQTILSNSDEAVREPFPVLAMDTDEDEVTVEKETEFFIPSPIEEASTSEKKVNRWKEFLQLRYDRDGKGEKNLGAYSSDFLVYKQENHFNDSQGALLKSKKRRRITLDHDKHADSPNTVLVLTRALSKRFELGGLKKYQIYRERDCQDKSQKPGEKPKRGRRKLKSIGPPGYGMKVKPLPSNQTLNEFEHDMFAEATREGKVMKLNHLAKRRLIDGKYYRCSSIIAIGHWPTEMKILETLNGYFSRKQAAEKAVRCETVFNLTDKTLKIRVAFDTIDTSNVFALLKRFARDKKLKLHLYENKHDDCEFGTGLLIDPTYCLETKFQAGLKANPINTLNSSIWDDLRIESGEIVLKGNCMLFADGIKDQFWSILVVSVERHLSFSMPSPFIMSRGKELVKVKQVAIKRNVSISKLMGNYLEIGPGILLEVKLRGIGGDNKYKRCESGKKQSALEYPIISSSIRYGEVGILIRKHGESVDVEVFLKKVDKLAKESLDLIKEHDFSMERVKGVLKTKLKKIQDEYLSLARTPLIHKGSQYDLFCEMKYKPVCQLMRFVKSPGEMKKYILKYLDKRDDQQFVLANDIPYPVTQDGKIDVTVHFSYPQEEGKLYHQGREFFGKIRKPSKDKTLKHNNCSKYGLEVQIDDDGCAQVEKYPSVKDYCDGKRHVGIYQYVFKSKIPRSLFDCAALLHGHLAFGIGIVKLTVNEMNNRDILDSSYKFLVDIANKCALKCGELKQNIFQKVALPHDLYVLMFLFKKHIKICFTRPFAEDQRNRLILDVNILFLILTRLTYVKYERKLLKILKTVLKDENEDVKKAENKVKKAVSEINEGIKHSPFNVSPGWLTGVDSDEYKNCVSNFMMKVGCVGTLTYREEEIPYAYPAELYSVDLSRPLHVQNGGVLLIRNGRHDGSRKPVSEIGEIFRILLTRCESILFVIKDDMKFIFCCGNSKVRNREVKHSDLLNSGNSRGECRMAGEITMFGSGAFLLDSNSSFCFNRQGSRKRLNDGKEKIWSSLLLKMFNFWQKDVLIVSFDFVKYKDVLDDSVKRIMILRCETIRKLNLELKTVLNSSTSTTTNDGISLETMANDQKIRIKVLNKLKLSGDDLIFQTLFYEIVCTVPNYLLKHLAIGLDILNEERMESFPLIYLELFNALNFKKNFYIHLFSLVSLNLGKFQHDKRIASLPSIGDFNYLICKSVFTNSYVFQYDPMTFSKDIGNLVMKTSNGNLLVNNLKLSVVNGAINSTYDNTLRICGNSTTKEGCSICNSPYSIVGLVDDVFWNNVGQSSQQANKRAVVEIIKDKRLLRGKVAKKTNN